MRLEGLHHHTIMVDGRNGGRTKKWVEKAEVRAKRRRRFQTRIPLSNRPLCMCHVVEYTIADSSCFNDGSPLQHNFLRKQQSNHHGALIATFACCPASLCLPLFYPWRGTDSCHCGTDSCHAAISRAPLRSLVVLAVFRAVAALQCAIAFLLMSTRWID